MALVSRSRSFAALSSLRLDFALRHLPRRRRAVPVTIVSALPSQPLIRITIWRGRHKILLHHHSVEHRQSSESFGI